ncbi:kinase-like domain-containing protein [Lactifluus subvellereus]|nr:kinase-like domain-containing protein [Lactifluus subvellereus]
MTPSKYVLSQDVSILGNQSQPIGQATLPKPVEGDNDSDCQSGYDPSETSSIIYSHETFETYKEKVALLLASLFSYEVASQAVLYHLQGGSYNRVIGISMPSGSDPECCTSEELILRVPRFEAADVQAESLLLIHLHKTKAVPSPEVIFYDSSSSNALEQPYILMRRLEGESLLTAHSKMNHGQRLAPAKTIAQLIAKIHNHPAPAGIGPLCVTDGSLFIGHYTNEGKYDCLGANYTPPSTTHEFFQTHFTELAIPGLNETEADWGPTLYRRLRDISKRVLHGLAFSQPGMNVLVHRNFAPRNIIFRPVARDLSNEKVWELSGIIDWDGCEVAPVEVAYNCPGWVWAHGDEGYVGSSSGEEDWDPDAPTFNDDCREIKEAFIEEIERLLPGFMEVVRQVRWRPLKKLWNLARNGMHSNEDAKIGEEIIAAFNALDDDD